MDSMSVDTGRVSQLSNDIRMNSGQLRDHLEGLERTMNTLRSQWTGEAQAAYDEAQRKWNTQLGEMQQLLERIAGKTEEISSGYLSTDNNAAKRFSL